MTVDRRKFLSWSLGAGAVANLPPSIQRALAAEPAVETGTLRDIKHVVILMQENRSFDHYFGTLRGVRGFGDRFPVPLESGHPVWIQSNGRREVAPFHLDPSSFNALLAPSTPHSFADSQGAWNQGKFGFWPLYKKDNSMGYYRREDIPFQVALAEAFTLCDAYHCSITSGTDPNRITFWSGSNFNPLLAARGINCTDRDSEPDNLRCWIANPEKDLWPVPGYTYKDTAFEWPTLPDLLGAAGVSWRIYQDPNDNWTGAMHGGLAFASFRNAKPGSQNYAQGMSHWTLEHLASHVRDGSLPAVSWVLPPRAFSEHPGAPSSPQKGAHFTEQVLNALTANPEVWSRTAFLLTFDENDGLFDHLPPPAPPSFRPDGSMAGKSSLALDGEYFSDPERKHLDPRDTTSGLLLPYGLSARVPMYVISPWSKGGWVCSQTFDHTSLALFLEKRFGLEVPNVSPWHRAVCGDLVSAFDFSGGKDAAMVSLPATADWQAREADQLSRGGYVVPETHQPLFQERGIRPSRALPYELHVDAVKLGEANISLTFSNTGSAGAVFHVYDRLNLADIPRRYTVEPGKMLSDEWDLTRTGGIHDLWVYGPNGFVRVFAGRPDSGLAALECTLIPIRSSGAVVVKLSNSGGAFCELEIVDEAYGRPVRLLTLAPDEEREELFDLADSGAWYDLVVRPAQGAGFHRRFAGRVETGRHGISDPALGT
jgi:phospholipase C